MKQLILLVLISLINYNGQAITINDSTLNLIKTKVQDMHEGFAISIAILSNNEVSYIGILKQNDSLITVDIKDSLFEIGSVTKVFTSTILANEVVNKTIKLEDDVNKAFKFKFNDKIKLTYLSLANHTSGMYRLPSNILPLLLTNPTNPYSNYSFDMFDSYLKKELTLKKRDSLRYSYSNLGAGLLAYSLSNNRKLPFETLLNMDIFTPYEMNATSYNYKTSFIGISENNEASDNWQFKALKGAGGLTSNVTDLTKFITAHFNPNNKVLNLTRQETFVSSKTISIGLAWHILHPNTDEKMFWHNGGTGGYTSSISFRPHHKTGVIILSNISAMHSKSYKIDELCFELLNSLN
jgi:CubicO group peptidase (beta-lactamase class C family)